MPRERTSFHPHGLHLLMGLVVELFDGGFFQGSIHALNLSVGPGMIDPGESVFDAVLCANAVEDVLEGVAMPFLITELGVVVGEHSVQFVRHGGDQVAQELSGFHLACRRVQLA